MLCCHTETNFGFDAFEKRMVVFLEYLCYTQDMQKIALLSNVDENVWLNRLFVPSDSQTFYLSFLPSFLPQFLEIFVVTSKTEIYASKIVSENHE